MSIRAVCFAFLFFLFGTVYSQRVAVVLSGGGSKGVSHVGMLRALEEEGVPIDYIAGTSMGAIVGGLYAAGYSPDEIECIFNSPEFPDWVTGKIDQRYIYYFKRPEPDASWISFKIKYDSLLQPQLPTNIVSPYRMDFEFMQKFAGANAVSGGNFDKLMIPFRCVAADIGENRAVILRNGDLGSAIRASMTFPFYFKPIRINDRLLFDGGMYNNFPVDVAYNDFFPDIIIGCKAAGNMDPPGEDNLFSQVQNMLMEKTSYKMICGSDILIEPNLTQVNVIDFNHTCDFIDSGYVATKRKIAEIRRVVHDTVTIEQRELRRQAFNAKKPPLVVKDVTVNGLSEEQQIYLRKTVQNQSEYDTTNTKGVYLATIEKDYFSLLGGGWLDKAYPQLLYDNEKKGYNLKILADREKRFFLDFGGNISSNATNEMFLQLRYDFWKKLVGSVSANTYLGRFYNSFSLNGRFDFPTRIPFVLTTSYIANRLNYMRTSNTYFFDYESPIYLRQIENFADIRVNFKASYESRIGVALQFGKNRYDYYQTNTFQSRDTLDKTYFTFFSTAFFFEKNSLNQKQYANQGTRFSASIQFVTGNEKYHWGSTSFQRQNESHSHFYPVLKLSWEKYFPKVAFYSSGFLLEGVVSAQPFFSNYTSTLLVLPEFAPIPEMTTIFQPQYRSPVYAAFGQRNVFSVFKNFDLRLEGYLMVPLQTVEQNRFREAEFDEVFSRFYYVISGAAVYQSPIGPVSLSLNWYDNTVKPLSFSVNIGYMLFNRRALQ